MKSPQLTRKQALVVHAFSERSRKEVSSRDARISSCEVGELVELMKGSLSGSEDGDENGACGIRNLIAMGARDFVERKPGLNA
jgi:hypothetical protein